MYGETGKGSLSGLTTVLAAASAALMLGYAAPASAAGCGNEYTIQAGDTLSRIASQCESSVEALMGANPQINSPSQLSVGWKLSVPGEGSVETTSAATDGERLAAIPEKDGPVLIEGWITNGARCAILATEDGKEIGVVSPEFSFTSGRAVAVEGHMVDDPSCSGANTLLVTALTTAEL